MSRVGAEDRIRARERRQKAREKARQRRKDELVGYKPGDRKYEEIKQRHQEEDWRNRQAARHNSWENQYGSRAQRRGMERMEQHARRRERDLDYIERVNAGEAEYEGTNLVGDTKSGPQWSQGSLDAYDYYKENKQAIKRGEKDFFYEDYVPKPGFNTGPNGNRKPRRRPSYEQYMGQYYDPNFGTGPSQGGSINGGRDQGAAFDPNVYAAVVAQNVHPSMQAHVR